MCGAPLVAAPAERKLPTDWQAAWDQPAARHRPLQIVHGIPLQVTVRGDEGKEALDERLRDAARKRVRSYQELGLGGLVCNVAFDDYMKSEQNWLRLIAVVEACQELGLIVWIYDEDGYPSGAAGGLVLTENRDFESLELAFDEELADPFIVRPAYEHTHASNNFYAARRYPNLIDDRAVNCFIEETHDRYWQRLEPYFGKTIQAMFTDEPSLIAVNIGSLGEEVRKKVRVVDPVDPNVRALPCVPWSYDLARQYEQRFGEDLIAQRRSLFAGDRAEDVRIRRQYWSLVSDLMADRYFGALERWCAARNVASSGHTLWEEGPLRQVPLEGSALKVLSRMQIPGLDMLNSNPEAVVHIGWLTAGLPSSSARLAGRRRVMTEVSDFVQKMDGPGPATLAEMRATAGWMATWGVTDFTLYYAPSDRSAEDYRAYCDFVGRLNAVLLKADPVAEVLLYYPTYDLWGEYLPMAEPFELSAQSRRAQRLVESSLRLGRMLQQSQIPFTLIDHEHLERGEVQGDGALKIGGQEYRTLVVPAAVELPAASATVVEKFSSTGGRVVRDEDGAAAVSQQTLSSIVQPAVALRPSSPHISLGRFVRDGHEVIVAVNVGSERYEGQVVGADGDNWLALDPASGNIERAERNGEDRLPLTLDARETRILVELGE